MVKGIFKLSLRELEGFLNSVLTLMNIPLKFPTYRGRQGISKLSYAKGLANGTLQLMQCAPSPRAIYAEEACHQPLYLVF